MTSAAEPGEVVGFDQVRSVLRKRCVTCHNSEELRGDLDLSSLNALLVGSSSGDVVVSGDSKKSVLYTTTAHLEEPTMPPNSPKIPKRELDILRAWIEGGLAESSATQAESNTASTASATDMKDSGQNAGQQGLAPVQSFVQAGSLAAVALSPDAGRVAMSGRSQVLLWDPTTGAFDGGLPFDEGEVTALRFFHNDLLLAAGGIAGLQGKVVAFDPTSGKRLYEVADETDTPLSVDLSADKRLIATGGPNKVVRLYDTNNRNLTTTLRKHTDWVLSLRFSPDGLLLASGDRFGGLLVWEVASGQLFCELRGHQAAVRAIDWSLDSNRLYSVSEDGTFRVWDINSAQSTLALRPDELGPLLDMDVTQGENGQIALAGRKGVAVYSLADSSQSIFQSHQDEQIDHVRLISQDQLFVGGCSGTIELLKISDSEQKVSTTVVASAARRSELLDELQASRKNWRERSMQQFTAWRESALGQLEDSGEQFLAQPENQPMLSTEGTVVGLGEFIQQLKQNRDLARQNLERTRASIAQMESMLIGLEEYEKGLAAQIASQEQLINAYSQSNDVLGDAKAILEQMKAASSSVQQLVDQLEQ